MTSNSVHEKPINNHPFLSARKISIFLGMKKFSRINLEKERNLFRAILKKSTLLRKLRKIYLAFKKMLQNGDSKELEIWIKTASELKLEQINRIIRGIKRDYNAVLNAIITNWSSGKVEGKINKLKTIKRQMYGRASLELLRRKVILSKTG